jgi:hypothetical protein
LHYLNTSRQALHCKNLPFLSGISPCLPLPYHRIMRAELRLRRVRTLPVQDPFSLFKRMSSVECWHGSEHSRTLTAFLTVLWDSRKKGILIERNSTHNFLESQHSIYREIKNISLRSQTKVMYIHCQTLLSIPYS